MNELRMLEKVRPYLAKQQDEDGKALYNEISEMLGYGITSTMLQQLVRSILQEEKKLYEIKSVVEKQSAMLVLNQKALRLQMETAMPTIGAEDKKQVADLLEEMSIRMASEIGVDLRNKKFSTYNT